MIDITNITLITNITDFTNITHITNKPTLPIQPKITEFTKITIIILITRECWVLRVLSLSMQSNITLVTIMASCAGFLLFFFVVAFLHFHEYLDYHCLRDRVFFSSKTLITILPSLHYQLHYHIALGLAIPTWKFLSSRCMSVNSSANWQAVSQFAHY